ncbi:MAG: M13 family metallopeptidase [Sphingobacteriaceae bacterium]|nr:M13 family metallopeptidase [Sphingobacteriaceae bacterium]
MRNVYMAFVLLLGTQLQAQPLASGIPRENLDLSTTPCENFYQYAAGGWMKANPMPETESRWGSFNKLAKQNDEKIKVILDRLAKGSSPVAKGSPEQLVGDFYRSALDTAALERLGTKPVQPYLAKIDALKDKKDLMKLLGELRPAGFGGFFSFYVGLDAKNSQINIVNLGQGGLGLPDRDYYLKTDAPSLEIQKAYVAYMTRLFKLAGVSQADNAASRVYAIEMQLAQASMSRVERRDPDKTYNKYSYADFSKDPALGYLKWQDFFAASATPDFKELVVGQVEFIKSLQPLIEKSSLTELKNYLKWSVLNSSAGMLTSNFEKAQFGFYQTTLSGTTVMKPRWERAVSLTNGSLGEVLGQLFVKEHFSKEAKAKVSEMVEHLRYAFKTRIEALDWMSETTKAEALVKLAAFEYKIGYPDKWKDYSKVDIRAGRLFENVVNTRRHGFAEMVAKIGQPVDKTEWGMTPQTVNAYYSPSRNEIVFPAGILQPPFYDPEAEDAVNYGGIGAVIGHEFSHGFDDKGSKYDASGNLSNWWTEEDRTQFEARTGKIVAQFNGYEVLEGININGSLTQGENIADLAGLTMAYYAYIHAKEGQDIGAEIEGYTWQQRFFLGWAQVWAQNISEKELRKRIITDSHSPGEYRVRGPLANMPEFWEAWGCTPGQGMVAPQEVQVKIW